LSKRIMKLAALPLCSACKMHSCE